MSRYISITIIQLSNNHDNNNNNLYECRFHWVLFCHMLDDVVLDFISSWTNQRQNVQNRNKPNEIARNRKLEGISIISEKSNHDISIKYHHSNFSFHTFHSLSFQFFCMVILKIVGYEAEICSFIYKNICYLVIYFTSSCQQQLIYRI